MTFKTGSKDVTTDTIHAAFHRTIMDSGVVRHVEKVNPDTGEQRIAKEVRHSYHDLRHTFAVQTYLEERRRGNVEPWKRVQVLLGHRNLGTTLKSI